MSLSVVPWLTIYDSKPCNDATKSCSPAASVHATTAIAADAGTAAGWYGHGVSQRHGRHGWHDPTANAPTTGTANGTGVCPATSAFAAIATAAAAANGEPTRKQSPASCCYGTGSSPAPGTASPAATAGPTAASTGTASSCYAACAVSNKQPQPVWQSRTADYIAASARPVTAPIRYEPSGTGFASCPTATASTATATPATTTTATAAATSAAVRSSTSTADASAGPATKPAATT